MLQWGCVLNASLFIFSEFSFLSILTPVMPSQVSTTQMAEHLVSALVEESDLLELGQHDQQARQRLEIEIERLHSRLEHTRAHNNVLALSLEECKTLSDK